MNTKRTKIALSISLGLIVLAIVFLSTVLSVPTSAAEPAVPAQPEEANGTTPAPMLQLTVFPMSGPDLVIQSITLDPPNPAPSQPTTITVMVKNIGTDAENTGFYTYLYIDPPQQPPDQTTTDTSYVGWFLGLNPGATFSWSYTDYEFATAGCDHIVYAWVDKQNYVAEDNETNNLFSVNVCVGGSSEEDAYEPADNECGTATLISANGVPQHHNLNSADDRDWYQFTGVGGIEYVIAANNVGANAQARLRLSNRCNVPPSFGSSGNEIRATLPTSGTYYIQVVNAITATTNTSYTLSINAGFDCSGYYEPNDTRETAREIPTDGSAQQHRFCAPGDVDWAKFTAQAGVTYTVRAVGNGVNATPVLQGFDSSVAAYSAITNPLQFAATTNGIYYVRVTNQISTAYGSTTDYSLQVTGQSCSSDEFEPDNTRAGAGTIPVNGGSQLRVACPAGDRDWARFSAVAGVTYTLETIGLGAKSDTVMCLYDNIGTQIACDDESGINHGSRIAWQAMAPGEYYVEIRQATDQSAGPETAYEFFVVTGLCRSDLYEPDDTASVPNLSWLPTDGSHQPHNFCPDNDRDWARINIPGAGTFTIETSALGPGSDTLLNLYDTDKTTLLATNDDYGPGVASQIVYTFTQAGTYYVEARHFNPARYGRSTSYHLSALAGTPTSTPTPGPGNPTPTPRPTGTPQPSGIQTLIVTNRAQLNAIYGTSRIDPLFDKLVTFVNHSMVQGEILEVEKNDDVAAAFAAWVADLTNIDKAQQTSSAIRGVVMSYLAAHPSVQYIVVVGDDRVIPARRVSDRTSYPEDQYASLVVTTTVGSAIANNFFLTDDFYADLEPSEWDGAELYIPDLAIGRLIETPEQITGMIDAFMISGQLTPDKVLVVGYDFVQDVAANICGLYGEDLGTSKMDCVLIGDSWNTSQFKSKQLNAVPPFKLQSINGHASHASQGGPVGTSISVNDIVAGTSDLIGAVIYSVGCHSGLNVPETSNQSLDLPEAFMLKRVNYVGNTGFGWGSSYGVYLSERLIQNYTQELIKGNSVAIGQALMRAKQRYYQESDNFEEKDEKILQQVTLYGFPMYRLNSGTVLGDEDPFPSTVVTSPFTVLSSANYVTSTTIFAAGQAGKGTININVSSAPGSGAAVGSQAVGFAPVSTDRGTFYQLDGHTNSLSNGPTQPQFYVKLAPPPQQQFRGVVFTGGTYYTQTIDPVIDVPLNEYITATTEPAFETSGFYPPVPFTLRGSDTISRTDASLAVVMGQYDSDSSVARLYNNVQYDLYYSLSDDQTGPTITWIDGYYNTRSAQATFKVEASDPSNVVRVLVAYTTGNGTWASVDLVYNAGTHKWAGTLPGLRNASYYIQAVDGAGNATAVSRKGGYFGLAAVDLPVERWTVYLPVVIKQ